MKTKIIEATNGPRNWGKFLVGRMDVEWERESQACPEVGGVHFPLLTRCGWSREHLWVLDLQTGEGIFVAPGGSARADLSKHEVWVCPMFEHFLVWLYEQDIADLDALPDHIDLPDAPFEMSGYRRLGEREPSAFAAFSDG